MPDVSWPPHWLGRFRAIVADPPWRYEDHPPDADADLRYATMPLCDIEALPVADLADPSGAHLYLWTTAPLLHEALHVLDAWGFRYKTALVWYKQRLGLGAYYRSETEYALFGIRGALPILCHDLSNVVSAPARRHSEKPDAAYRRFAAGSPGPRVDMFARRGRDGWSVWGNEIPGGWADPDNPEPAAGPRQQSLFDLGSPGRTRALPLLAAAGAGAVFVTLAVAALARPGGCHIPPTVPGRMCYAGPAG